VDHRRQGRPVVNRTQLEAWFARPAGQKPMYSEPAEGELPRGMPNLELSESEIDQIVTYLETLGAEPPIQTAEGSN
jgi:hypothetical protein